MTPVDSQGHTSTSSSGWRHSPGLSLACPVQLCDHGQTTKPPWALWGLELKRDLQSFLNVTLGVNGLGYTRGVPGFPTQTQQGSPSYLVCQDGERSFEASGRPVLGRPREPLCVVTDLGFQGVDLGDDLLGSDNVLWYVDYGLAAGRCTRKDKNGS